jgi:asparagine synthase (glutamine-hydrolysing)
MQDTLRGPVLGSIPFFDQKKIVSLLDRLNSMDDGARVVNDQVLMTLVSVCVLHERLHLS